MVDSDFTANDPLRPADWRFQLARQLNKQQRFLSRSKYDCVTRALARYFEIRRQYGIGE